MVYNGGMLPQLPAESERVFHGRRIDVHVVQVPGRDGRRHDREMIAHPGAVTVLPLLDEQTVVLIRNERFAIGQTLWDLPAGTLEPPPETPQSCAARELIEETGYRGASVVEMCDFYTTPGFCNERMWAFVATGLTHVGQDLDESEQITVEAVAYNQSMQMIRDGQIVDGKTIATLLYYDRFTRNRT